MIELRLCFELTYLLTLLGGLWLQTVFVALFECALAEGLATLEVPNEIHLEFTVVPELIETVGAVELLVAGTQILFRVEDITYGKGERKLFAKTLFQRTIDRVCRPDDGIAHLDSVVIAP